MCFKSVGSSGWMEIKFNGSLSISSVLVSSSSDGTPPSTVTLSSSSQSCTLKVLDQHHVCSMLDVSSLNMSWDSLFSKGPVCIHRIEILSEYTVVVVA